MIPPYYYPSIPLLRDHPHRAALFVLDTALHLAEHALMAVRPIPSSSCCSDPITEFDTTTQHLILAARALRAQIERYVHLSDFIVAASRSRATDPLDDDDPLDDPNSVHDHDIPF